MCNEASFHFGFHVAAILVHLDITLTTLFFYHALRNLDFSKRALKNSLSSRLFLGFLASTNKPSRSRIPYETFDSRGIFFCVSQSQNLNGGIAVIPLQPLSQARKPFSSKQIVTFWGDLWQGCCSFIPAFLDSIKGLRSIVKTFNYPLFST